MVCQQCSRAVVAIPHHSSVACLVAGDMTLVSAFIECNANMARERCSAVCAALVQTVTALAALPDFAQQVPCPRCSLNKYCLIASSMYRTRSHQQMLVQVSCIGAFV